MTFFQVQTDFTHGELSPLMRARFDTALYLKAAEKLQNVLVVPQGAAQRRFGLDFMREFITANENEYQMFEFQRTEEDPILLILFNLQLRIFELDGSEHPDSPIATPWSGALIANSEVKYAQTHNAAIFTHPDFISKKLLFESGGSPDFRLLDFTFKNFPTFDFQDVVYSGITFSMPDVDPQKTSVLTASSAIFDSEHVGGVFMYLGGNVADPIGIARITSLSSASVANVRIITTFNEAIKTAVLGVDAILEKVAFSATRGWPRTVTFYENRLLFGGSKTLPQTLFFSQIADYEDFSLGTADANEAIILTISSNDLSAIDHVIADKGLQVFTRSGEFAPPQVNEQALTPDNTISIRKQSSNGVSPQVQPVVADNVTFYIRKGGKAVMAFVYADGTASYNSLEASTTSEHLISSPVDAAVLKGREESDANFLFVINSGTVERVDETESAGSVAIFQVLSEENVRAWTLTTTVDGEFKRVQNVGNDVFFIVQRTINGGTRQFLEKINFDSLMDSMLEFTFVSPTTTVTGLEHLEDELVDVIGDGIWLNQQIVNLGQITVAAAHASQVFQIGLPISPVIRTMPINVPSGQGPLLYLPKRIPRQFIDFFNSQGIEVDGILIPNFNFEPAFISGPLPLVTGLFERNNLGGWDRRQTITITQEGPYPMTILGIGYEVEI